MNFFRTCPAAKSC